MKKENLEDKIVTLYLDGGWELYGLVVKDDDKKLIIEHEGSLHMVFKDKISCLILSERERTIKATHSQSNKDESIVRLRNNKIFDHEEEVPFPTNGMTYDETAMSLPGTLLGMPVKDMDDDLSVYYSGGAKLPTDDKNLVKDKLSFEVKDDSKD